MLQRDFVGRLLALLALAGALVLAGTASAETGILAVGDFGVGGDTQRATGEAMRRFEATHPAQLLVTLGDNDYTRSPTAFRRNWTASFGWLTGAGVAPAGSLGNHDVEVQGGRYEFELLGMPRAFYRRSLPHVDVFILNSNRVTATQTKWLRSRLVGSTARWQVVVLHHPPFSCGGHEGSATVRRAWKPLFERFGVDLVLSGHDHNYQRFAARRDVRYVVHGGGGANFYPLHNCPSSYPRRVAARVTHGFLYLVAGENTLRVSALSRSGSVVNAFKITR
jgi:calcineurin-like phosphoesterase family protein